MTDWLPYAGLALALFWLHRRHKEMEDIETTPFRRAALRWHEQRRQADRRRDRELGLVRSYRRQA